MHDVEEFNDHFALWSLENHSPDWVLFRSPDATTLVRNKAASYGGLISISHFIQAFDELRASGEIKQLRLPKPAVVEEPELSAEAYRKMSAREVTRRYMNDQDFKVGVDTLISQGLI